MRVTRSGIELVGHVNAFDDALPIVCINLYGAECERIKYSNHQLSYLPQGYNLIKKLSKSFWQRPFKIG